MRRIRTLAVLAAAVFALTLAPQTSGAYCDPETRGCSNSCKKTQQALERFGAGDLILCPQ